MFMGELSWKEICMLTKGEKVMKKFLVVILVVAVSILAAFVTVSIAGCGQDAAPGEENPQEFCFTDSMGQEICSTEFKEAWYEAFYSDCLSLCTVCETMAKDFCGFRQYTKEACIETIWYFSPSNSACVSYMDRISVPEQKYCTGTESEDYCKFIIVGRI